MKSLSENILLIRIMGSGKFTAVADSGGISGAIAAGILECARYFFKHRP